MSLLIDTNTVSLWRNVVKTAEDSCSIKLHEELEAYLVMLLARYVDKPEVAKQIFAITFLEAANLKEKQRNHALQYVGDGCLLFAGLFPKAAERRHVKVSYFVDLGRAAYAGISDHANDLYHLLAVKFVVLMDVLQSIQNPDLLPLDAYQQWNDLGSQRALRILREYTTAIPITTHRR